jgi:hypothetical protein
LTTPLHTNDKRWLGDYCERNGGTVPRIESTRIVRPKTKQRRRQGRKATQKKNNQTIFNLSSSMARTHKKENALPSENNEDEQQ